LVPPASTSGKPSRSRSPVAATGPRKAVDAEVAGAAARDHAVLAVQDHAPHDHLGATVGVEVGQGRLRRGFAIGRGGLGAVEPQDVAVAPKRDRAAVLERRDDIGGAVGVDVTQGHAA
jgi:hypothetical protein